MIAHKIRLEPNNKQVTYFKKACGVARLAWNYGLAKWDEQYKLYLANNKDKQYKPNGLALKKEFNSIKKDIYPFVYEVTKYASQQPFIELQEAFNRFFKGISKRPKFKKKGKSKDSFYIGGDQIKVKQNRVKIPNLGYVKLSEDIRFNGKISSATISRIADNWFISFTIEPLISYLPCKNQASVGVDVGSKALATLSNGLQIFAPKPLKRGLRKLKRLSRQLSKKQHSKYKGDKTPKSNNYIKQQLKVSKLHQKISNIRQDSLHKLTTYLTDNFKYIAIEDLNIKGMMANSKLSLTISDLGLYEFKRQLEYKARNRGNIITVANRFYPSSKTCSNCGNKKQDLKLSDRVYICTHCGLEIDRDLNASINLKNQIPQVLWELKPVEITAMLNSNLTTSIVESGSEHQSNLTMSKIG